MLKKIIPFLLVFSFISSLYASEKENVIRAVVLERIAQFVSYKDLSKEFNICVYKNKTLSKSFKNLYDGRSYKNLPIKVLDVSVINKLEICNVVYISNLTKRTKAKILKKSKEQILLVSQNVDDINNGYMIALYFEKKKLKFNINQGAIVDAGLKVNYRLLTVASKVVNPRKAN